jgi:hypothetical protein
MKLIILFGGATCQVDDEDYEELNRYKWYCWRNRRNPETTQYAYRPLEKKKHSKFIKMHRDIMKPEDGFVVDHIDGDGLNNQKSNLRICVNGDNIKNCMKKSMSGYKGVVFQHGGWIAQGKVNGKQMYLGRHKTAEEAAIVFNEWALSTGNPFYKLNIIGQPNLKAIAKSKL